MSQPFYHLRPNKYVDRHLFVAALERLNTFTMLKSYRYIGFGSYMFDDFKLLHERLDISSMVSLESDPVVCNRAKYNKPYKCIRIVNQSSTDYIAGDEWGIKKTIIWLDYTAPKNLAQQFNDVSALLNLLNTNDVFRVTFNANVSSLGDPPGEEDIHEYRLKVLKERIGEYVPVDTKPQNMTKNGYPLVLLKALHKMIGKSFVETQYDRRFLFPMYSTVYEDGQMMLTFTGVILDDHSKEKELKKIFKGLGFVNFEWDKPSKISIPELTVKEMIEMNKLLPSGVAQEQLKKKFDFVFSKDSEIESFAKFYKFYPSYQSVSF